MPNSLHVYQAAKLLKALHASGLQFFPLGVESKMPRDKGFLLHDYGLPDFAGWMERGGNWGIKARAGDLFIDIDPRHGGNESFEMLKWEVGDDFSRYPTTTTGSGGRHIFMRRPPEGRWRWHVKGYPGIDFQGLGRYVVAPGSIHPDTKRPYTLHMPSGQFELLDAPPALVELLRKPPRAVDPNTHPGAISEAVLARLLRRLDVMDFASGGQYYGEWLDISMGCHYATNGEGWQAWLDWCDGDPNRAAEGEQNLYRWDSFDADRSDGVTFKTLLRAVARTGKDGSALVRDLRVRGEKAVGNHRTTAIEDFGALMDDVPTPDELEPEEMPDSDGWESDV